MVKGFALHRARSFDNFGIVKRGREAMRRAEPRPAAPRSQSGKGGVYMGDGIGTDGAVFWLERAESALFGALLRAAAADDAGAAGKWVDLLERLSIV